MIFLADLMEPAFLRISSKQMVSGHSTYRVNWHTQGHR